MLWQKQRHQSTTWRTSSEVEEDFGNHISGSWPSISTLPLYGQWTLEGPWLSSCRDLDGALSNVFQRQTLQLPAIAEPTMLLSRETATVSSIPLLKLYGGPWDEAVTSCT